MTTFKMRIKCHLNNKHILKLVAFSYKLDKKIPLIIGINGSTMLL